MYEESQTEHPLPGGNFDGAVVRVGDTVRRSTGPWTPAVHALLDHLAAVGFVGAPGAHGIDSHGREILSFMRGDAGQYPLAAFMRSDAALVAAARLLRSFHDATVAFRPPKGPVWRQAAPDPGPIEVICHNDWAPYNAVFQQQRLTGFFDWDFARPGSRLWDLAWTAHTWVPLREDTGAIEQGWDPPPDRPARLRLLVDAYGLEDRRSVLPAIHQRVLGIAAWLEDGADRGEAVCVRLVAEGHAAGYRQAAAYLDRSWEELERAL